ncbi:MAG: translation initiation factor IF-2 [Planctomycetes bacterium]|nr:translation initiation factor IF-2 [Planctomycetota bacterium]
MRTRLYDLARELGVANNDLVAKCRAMGMDVKSHSSTIDEAQTAAVRAAYGAPAPAPGAAPAAPPAPPQPEAAAPPAPGEAKEEAGPPPAPRPRPGRPPVEEEDLLDMGPAGVEKIRKRTPAREEREGPPGVRRAAPPKAREGAEILRRIELPKQDTSSVREYGPHVRVKERRAPGVVPPRRRVRRPDRRDHRVPLGRPFVPLPPARPTRVVADFPVTARSLSQSTGTKLDELMATLVKNSVMVSVNDPLGDDVVAMLGASLGMEIEVRRQKDLETELAEAQAAPDRPEDLRPRPPVVAFLGHVDHGKTSLLDAIRKTRVAAGEAGGITQHIGAYTVVQEGRIVTFLDTPGHQAFTAMRARGAQVTDIVVLVVAADDGVMPQTEEAINHARAASVPIVVAVNKIDLPAANPQRVMEQLSNRGLLPVQWGGDTEMVHVSAVTGAGISDLIVTLALQAEILELKADPAKPARGVVLEAKLSEGRGPVATILVREGTLRRGDVVLCGTAYGRARSLHDHRGIALDEAGPSIPVEISGLSSVPAAGDPAVVLADHEKARDIAATRERRAREASFAERQHVTLENLFATLKDTGQKEVRVILKADVHGTLEVIRKAMADLSTSEVRINLLHSAVGGINDSDVLLADASDAVIIGFSVVPEPSARALAEKKDIEIRLYNIIYHLTDEMKAALERRLEPERRQVVLGHADVRKVFKVSKVGTVAGCYVTDGRITRSSLLRLTRNSIVVYEGKVGSLRHLKDDIREAANGQECGIKIAGYDDVKEGDVIEAYEIQEIKRKL